MGTKSTLRPTDQIADWGERGADRAMAGRAREVSMACGFFAAVVHCGRTQPVISSSLSSTLLRHH